PTAEELFDLVAAEFLSRLQHLYRRFIANEGDATAAGLRAEIAASCLTIGQQVRIELPGGEVLSGRAQGLGDQGELIFQAAGAIAPQSIFAGDITHIRSQSV